MPPKPMFVKEIEKDDCRFLLSRSDGYFNKRWKWRIKNESQITTILYAKFIVCEIS